MFGCWRQKPKVVKSGPEARVPQEEASSQPAGSPQAVQWPASRTTQLCSLLNRKSAGKSLGSCVAAWAEAQIARSQALFSVLVPQGGDRLGLGCHVRGKREQSDVLNQLVCSKACFPGTQALPSRGSVLEIPSLIVSAVSGWDFSVDRHTSL